MLENLPGKRGGENRSMKLGVLSVVVEFALLPICQFCIQDARLRGWFIVTLDWLWLSCHQVIPGT